MLRITGISGMGLGKTYAGSQKIMQLDARVNLVVCQKSKIDDWIEHFDANYSDNTVFDLTEREGGLKPFLSICTDPYLLEGCKNRQIIGVINYDLVWRRGDLLQLRDFTLLLDESSLIQNETAKRSKFILKMQPKNVILLSGTPTGGKYQTLWSQLHLLGWNISKEMYWRQYVNVEYLDTVGRSIPIVTGYKNVDRLKRKMAQYGCQFLKTDEVFDLPAQIFQKIRVESSKEYHTFRKKKVISIKTERPFCEYTEGDKIANSDFYGKDVTPTVELVGDTTLTRMLYERQLCGMYSESKLKAFEDLVESTNDRLIVFYNFTAELDGMQSRLVAMYGEYETARRCSIVNGKIKALNSYEKYDDSITFVQYQAGAMGLNLQKACRMIFYTLPLSSELYEQAKKRIHRIGQEKPCFYYQLICKGSIEEKILKTLEMRKDYTEKLFERGDV